MLNHFIKFTQQKLELIWLPNNCGAVEEELKVEKEETKKMHEEGMRTQPANRGFPCYRG